MTIDSQPDTHRSGIGEQENTGGSQDRPEPAGEPGQSTARTYDKQWPVKGYGYWRNTWYPSKQEHRQQFVYVPGYMKGPEGAPMVGGERVNVLRR